MTIDMVQHGHHLLLVFQKTPSWDEPLAYCKEHSIKVLDFFRHGSGFVVKTVDQDGRAP